MGVPGLWKELQSHGSDIALARLSELCAERPQPSKPFRLGIDVSSWMYHAQKSTGGHQPLLRSFFWRLCRLLAVPRILPVFVFDGPLRPSEKRGKTRHTYREAAFVTPLRDLIAAFGFVCFEAAGEAEAEMASMNRAGLLDAVMSDDVDCFVFGAALVIRNWSQDLAGSKARLDFVSQRESASSSSGEEPSSGRIRLPSKDRLALGKNLITYFAADGLHRDGLSQSGFILVALLSGGDYDVKGLPRCGVKISTALARAGYGDSLLAGLHQHCAPPPQRSDAPPRSDSHRPAAPQTQESWPIFLEDWLASLRDELSTNKSGHLGRKFKKLADSVEMADLLSTNASLCVLGSYAWPLTSGESPAFAFGRVEIGRIAGMCQRLFCWSAPLVLETFRNKLWEGCAMRELSGEGMVHVDRVSPPVKGTQRVVKPVRTTTSGKHDTEKGKISSFFSAKVGETTSCASLQPGLAVSVEGEREHGTTGYMHEIRLVCNVCAYVDMAKRGLDWAAREQEVGEHDAAPTSSQRIALSPRKRRPFAEPSENLRVWMPMWTVESSKDAAHLLVAYHRKQAAKKTAPKTAADKTTQRAGHLGDNGRIDFFFNAAKQRSSAASGASKVAPTKRTLPPHNSSLSLPQFTAQSQSPSPTPDKERLDDRGLGSDKREPVWAAQWNDAILDEIEVPASDTSFGNESLPVLRLPTRARRQGPSADDSVEFVSLSPAKGKRMVPSQSIEVSDDSDQDG